MSAVKRWALLIDPEYTIIDAHPNIEMFVQPTPKGWDAGGWAGFLLRMLAVLAGEMVVVLTEAAYRQLGPLVEVPGWDRGVVDAFTTYRRGDDTAVHVARWELLAGARCPLWEPGLAQIDFVTRLRAWHDVTGHAYRGVPAIAGTAILRDLLTDRKRTPNPSFFLAPWDEGWRDCERAYSRRMFGRRLEAQPGSGVWEHEYDIKDSYPSAMSSALVARQGLKHRPDIRRFDPTLSGFWQVDVEAWPADHPMPDPSGYRKPDGRDQHETRWLTSPTLMLLEELHAAGVHGGYSIRDAWVEKGFQEFKSMRLTTRAAVITAREHSAKDWFADPGQADALVATLKECTHEALGLTARKGGRLYRPDWQQAVIATARCNLWRKCWTVYKPVSGPNNDGNPGRAFSVPHGINTDAVYYLSADSDPYRAAPLALDVRQADAVEAGKFKVDPGKSREVKL